jgi:CheY-like chemotaxis protein
VGSLVRSEAIATTARSGPCVLFVDDHADTVEGFATYFRSFGLIVHTAATGREALRLAQALRPDVVVLDLSIPDMDGIEVMDALRADDETAGTPIVVFTGAPPEKYPGHRANAWVSKPCFPTRLLDVVREVTSRPR